MRSRNVVIGVVSSVLVVAAALGLLLLLGPADGDDESLPAHVGATVATDGPAAVDGRDTVRP